MQNAIVICRPDQYGNPLRELGVECRKERDDKGYRFGLFKVTPLVVAPNAASVASKPQDAKAMPSKAKTDPKAKTPQAKAGKAKKASK